MCGFLLTPDVRGSGQIQSPVTNQASITKMRILHCDWQCNRPPRSQSLEQKPSFKVWRLPCSLGDRGADARKRAELAWCSWINRQSTVTRVFVVVWLFIDTQKRIVSVPPLCSSTHYSACFIFLATVTGRSSRHNLAFALGTTHHSRLDLPHVLPRQSCIWFLGHLSPSICWHEFEQCPSSPSILRRRQHEIWPQYKESFLVHLGIWIPAGTHVFFFCGEERWKKILSPPLVYWVLVPVSKNSLEPGKKKFSPLHIWYWRPRTLNLVSCHFALPRVDE